MIFGLQLYQIIIAALSAVMIYKGMAEYIRREAGQTLLKLLVRLVVWGGMGAVVVFPSITNIFARVIGIEGNVNAAILTGFLLIFLIIFKMFSAIEKLEQNISMLARNDALKNVPRENNSNKQ
ncbi:DUF2304 domain-containing protein [bacterium]|nr:MAG: DUF2304 domain-containing protein [bacterium]